MTLGWFLSRSTMFATRSTNAAAVARVVAELVVVRVRLDVRLVDHVEPEPVAEVEPVRVVRVVRRADGVDVEPLHQPRRRVSIDARVSARPRVSSCSWRLTPAISTGWPLTSSCRSRDLDACGSRPRTDDRLAAGGAARACRAPAAPPTSSCGAAHGALEPAVGERSRATTRSARVEQARRRRRSARADVTVTQRPSHVGAPTSTSRMRRRARGRSSAESPACHHWSWSSMKLASDQRTTTATSSFGAVVADELR